MAETRAQAGVPSGLAENEMPASETAEGPHAEETGVYPPYPPYSAETAPPSVAETIIAGRDIRRQFKFLPQKPVRSPPRPAKPRGPKATDVKLSKRAFKSHAQCLRRHGAVLTDRLEYMAKPRRRNIIYLWREHANILPAETIARIRSMLDADEPFKPDQAYEYFVNLRKSKKKRNKKRIHQIKQDMMAICDDKRFLWARNATVAFARGIQQRLARPGRYALADGMLRLSNLILDDICGYMKMKTPTRNSNNPKARFMMEMADKIAVWIDEILSESDDRMLMMDFDEDEDILAADAAGDAGFADDFLHMMQHHQDKFKQTPVYKKFTGDMLEAFTILTNAMYKNGDQNLIEYGKFHQSYTEAANLLKETPSFEVKDIISGLAEKINHSLSDIVKPLTNKKLTNAMNDIVDLCSNYLAENADLNKDKGPAFKVLINKLRKQPKELLYQKEKLIEKYEEAAKELTEARGLESDHDDPNLTKNIEPVLQKLVMDVTKPEIKSDMDETIDVVSKYLSQSAVDKSERGPAFKILIKVLNDNGAEPFTPQFPDLGTNFAAAHSLITAPGLTSIRPNQETKPIFEKCLHNVVDLVTPKNMKQEMNDVIKRCANYLSGFARDREKVLKLLLDTMKKSPKKELAKRKNYRMDYATGADEAEKTPVLIPHLPVKDIAQEIKEKLATDVKPVTPPDLQGPMQSLTRDVAEVLSQPVAMKSGAAGEKYPMNYLIAVEKSMGAKKLFDYKGYNETYSGAAELLQRHPLSDTEIDNPSLEAVIEGELKKSIPPTLTPIVAEGLAESVVEASHHLASIGTKKAIALEHLTGLMKEKGEAQLVHSQGYDQTYNDGASRITNAPSLATEKVDEAAYENVKKKLDALTEQKPPPEKAKDEMKEIVEDVSKFLASPLPETESERRRLLAELMTRKDNAKLAEDGIYKMTFKDGAEEIIKAPMEPPKIVDEKLKTEMIQKISPLIPQEKEMQDALKDTVTAAAGNLADIMKRRGEVIKLIHDGMKKENEKSFLSIGKFEKTHKQAAEMLEKGPNFTSADDPDPSLVHKVSDRVKAIPIEGLSAQGKAHVEDAVDTVSKYIAGVATKECGLDPTEQTKTVTTNYGDAGKVMKPKKVSKGTTGYNDTLLKYADMDHEQALQILHQKLKEHGQEIFYNQPHNELTYAQASEWITNESSSADKSVKDSADTARLHKKFERKLSALTTPSTTPELKDAMQDVIIETAQILSETFISKNYKALAREVVISEMQHHGNEILVDVDKDTETYFYSAQRLKKSKNLETTAPHEAVQRHLNKKLEQMMKTRGTPRKISPQIKDYTQNISEYLSEHVTVPDNAINAYVALLREMETAGERPLVEGKVRKSHKEAATYLSNLTSFEDDIKRPDQSLQLGIENKLKNLMANVKTTGYEKSDVNNVIHQNAELLTSYIKLQEEKTEALKILTELMDDENGNVLLRHGTIRKTYQNGARLLWTKNADQLNVGNPDPVVARKIQIKLQSLINKKFAANKFKNVIDDVAEDVTNYLAVHFLQPEIIQVCKCMKNVFVQCELWCDESLRRLSRPCCSCTRRVAIQSISDICPGRRLKLSSNETHVCSSDLEISLKTCPSKRARFGESSQPCPASLPTFGCQSSTTAAYVFNTSHGPFDDIPTKLSETNSTQIPITISSHCTPELGSRHSNQDTYSDSDINLKAGPSHKQSQHTFRDESDTIEHYMAPACTFDETPTAIPAHVNLKTLNIINTARDRALRLESSSWITRSKNVFSSRTPIITTDQMFDWHSMMISLMWNVNAWRAWIHDNINNIIIFQEKNELNETWTHFQRTTTTEILQWHQYNSFSRQLIARIASKYKNKRIVSPTRTTVKTRTYLESHNEMLELIDTFNTWTHWFIITIKETDLLLQYKDSSSERWRALKEKVKECMKEWDKYNNHLSVSWETRFKNLISDWVPGSQQPGPVWVVSACGSVPSGAVAAGVCDGEVIWVARTTHKCKILPAALYPSRHCCIVYSGGRVHHYTKYQVMCNAAVQWVACRAGNLPTGAVRVGDVYVARIRYRASYLLGSVTSPHHRCCVVMFGRSVVFDCYELLVMEDEQT